MTDESLSLYRNHPRTYRENRFVYPVLSRRSGGISLGINLNPDKICNFDCIYCQVDRRSDAETRFVETELLMSELDAMFRFITEGTIYQDTEFRHVPPSLRRLNDVAFSGDGEPTTYRNIDSIISAVADRKRQHKLDQTKLVLITNASMFHRAAVRRALDVLDRNNGEIWAKLDAGTAEYFQQVDRTRISFHQILENITAAARDRPLVIQSLFMRIDDVPPSDAEIESFCNRLRDVTAAGGQIRLVQVYTVARRPAESNVTPLKADEVEKIAASVSSCTGLRTESFC